MELALLILASSLIIGITEFAKRKFSVPTLYTRRFTHIGTSIVAGVSPLFITQHEIIFVSILFAVVLLLSRNYPIFSAIHSVDRHTYGDVFLPLGVAATALFFLPDNVPAFQFGIFAMGISDALAGVAGETIGKHSFQVFCSRKSIEGSMVFFISTTIIATLIAHLSVHQILLIAAALTVAEFIAVYGLDNLILSLLGAFLLQLFK